MDRDEPSQVSGRHRASALRLWRGWWIGEAASTRYEWRPSTDVYEVEGGALIQIELAGVVEDDIRIACDGGRLVVVGERRGGPPPSALRCHLMEIASGRFRAEIDLPWPVDSSTIEVSSMHGILRVFVPHGANRAGYETVCETPAAGKAGSPGPAGSARAGVRRRG